LHFYSLKSSSRSTPPAVNVNFNKTHLQQKINIQIDAIEIECAGDIGQNCKNKTAEVEILKLLRVILISRSHITTFKTNAALQHTLVKNISNTLIYADAGYFKF